MNLSINPEFKNLIPALDKNEYDQLEESILSEGCRESIVAWNNTIVDGHNRYEICTNHQIDFNVIHKEFESESHAKLWMIDNQLGRRNLTDFMRIELNLSKKPFLSEMAKANKISAGKLYGENHPKEVSTILSKPLDVKVAPCLPIDTRAAIAKASGKSEGTVSKVEQVIKTGDEQLIAAARSGSINITEAASLAKLEPAKRAVAVERIKQGESPKDNILHSSDSNEWYTPARYADLAKKVMGDIDLDPASCIAANQSIQAKRIFDIEDDGFSRNWSGRVWLNPPYGRGEEGSNQAAWSKKLIDEYKAGRVSEGMLLVNAATGNKWFADLWEFPICFVDHRIRFISPRGDYSQPTHSNVIVYLGSNEGRFVELFSEIGTVAKRVINE